MTTHPCKDGHGNLVEIQHPHTASEPTHWAAPNKSAIATPGMRMPAIIAGIPVLSWRNAPGPLDVDAWGAVAQAGSITEPAFNPPAGTKHAAGAVITEADGRVWLVAPTNAFGGYKATFPKGRIDLGMSMQATAIKEAFEETGLHIELVSHLIDTPRSTTFTRFYLARRIGGDPADMGWESQAVLLVPRYKLPTYLNSPYDTPVLGALRSR